jgi:glycosyltransferase involved in cell wall biosynthesis
MIVSGFTFIRNGVKFDYPFLESIRSFLPVVDELVVAVGDCEDSTRELLLSLSSPKLKIVDTVWDPHLRSGGSILAQQTNVALDHISGDWGFYLQGDEVIHEDDQAIIRQACLEALPLNQIEGLLFDYVHFYGGYQWIGNSRRWYRREVRIIRNGIGVRSWGDAQGFRRQGKKLHVQPVNARIYHYGWVKPPKAQQDKLRSFHRLWHSDERAERMVKEGPEYAYEDGGRLKLFAGTHPAVMHDRVKAQSWEFEYQPERLKVPVKDRVLDALEDLTNIRVGEYKNYALL